ncbi:helix-turn-helix domain-containing protein [Streptococcus ruminicola]|uniref:Helix-turn-helix domain-containing protein n=1 Tax=Streptococcus ruminicola TaxID=2686210 RepID=A0A6G8I211_9STRE|nr:helix-turn-helix transcriptional regulator [Streptococcus ruminicola]QGX00614.1 helix-turn-helix domain-containing protein [Streptococcus ruminicola]QIM47149.1 helix-turn-helix domain-containing protein [Streptococcus ruminicola]
MGILLASRIKNRRKELKMSQKELADGICKQGQISRLENGEYTPGSELLYQLAKKLNVSMDYFFDEHISDESVELIEFKKISKNFINHRNYESLKYIYELEKGKSHRLSLSDKIYLEWVGSLVDFYFFQKREEAMENLEEILKSLTKIDINYLQISNTLFNFYYDTENLDKFDRIKEDLNEQIMKLSLDKIEELELSIKFNYNLSRYYWLQKNIDLAIKQVTATIRLCQEYRTSYLLADLFLLLGNLSLNFSEKKTVKSYFEIAHFLYKYIEDNNEMALTVEHYIADKFQD